MELNNARSTYNILFIDEKQEFLNSFQNSCGSRYVIHAPATVDQALSFLKKNEVDVIVVNQRIGGVSGIDFLVKASYKHPEIPSVLLVNTNDYNRIKGNKKGAHLYLVDNFDPDHFSMIISQLIEKSRRKNNPSESINQYLENQKNIYRVVERTFDAIITIDENQKIVALNDSASALFGFNKLVLLNKSLSILIPKSDPHNYKELVAGIDKLNSDVDSKSLSFNSNMFGLNSSGKLIPIEVVLSKIEIDEKNLYTLIITDVSRRIKINSALRISEEKFKDLFDSMIDLFIRANNDGVIELISPSVLNILGYKPEEILGKKLVDYYVNPSEQELLVHLIKENGICENFHAEFYTKDQQIKVVSINAKIYFDKNGVSLGIESIIRDITQQKKTEKKLIESKWQFQSLFEDSPDAIFIQESDIITHVNFAFLNLYGYEKKEDIVGKSALKTLFVPKDHAIVTRTPFKLLSESVYKIPEVGQIRQDGSVFHTETYISGIVIDGILHFQFISRDISERKKMEEIITANTSLLKESQKIAHLGHLNWNLTTNQIEWSDEVYRIYGVNAKIKPTVDFTRSLIHPDDLDFVNKNLKLAIQQLKVYNIEYRVIRADNGKVIWVKAQAKLIFNARGIPTSFIGTLLDITEKKSAEEVISQSEEKFRSIFETSNNGIALVNTKGEFLQVNQRFRDLFGYTETDLKNMTVLSVSFPEKNIELQQRFNDVACGKIPFLELEQKYKKVDGDVIICRLYITASMISEGNPLFVTVSLTDITEQKKAQEILTVLTDIQNTFIAEASPGKSFEKMLTILLKVTQSEYGFIGEVIYKPNGSPYLKTRAISNIYKPEEFSNFFGRNAANGLEFNDLENLFGRVMTTGKPIIENNPKDHYSPNEFREKSFLPDSFMGLPFFNNNELVGVVGITNKSGGYNHDDISLLEPFLSTCSTLIRAYKNAVNRENAQKKSERIREGFTRELEIKVYERTEDLQIAQKQLMLSLKKEKELGELKSRFVSTASHQFRTPLTVILSSMGVLSLHEKKMSEEFKPTFEKAHNRIKEQIERMTGVMNDVLILGKINAGNVKPKFNPVNLKILCEEIANRYNEIQIDGRTLSHKVVGTPYTLNLDTSLIEHSISNFISNAFKYSIGRPSPILCISFDNNGVKISIKDFGIGIPKKDMKHLFDPFFRASNVMDVVGTGLGTSIAKEYIELNNGSIEVISNVEEGSEFILTFDLESN